VDFVFAPNSQNVTPANNEGRLYLISKERRDFLRANNFSSVRSLGLLKVSSSRSVNRGFINEIFCWNFFNVTSRATSRTTISKGRTSSSPSSLFGLPEIVKSLIMRGQKRLTNEKAKKWP
jgi:hypothetical protein